MMKRILFVGVGAIAMFQSVIANPQAQTEQQPAAQVGQFSSEDAILDTSILFAIGAHQADQSLRGAFGWDTFQEGLVDGVYFRFDPDGYARFAPNARLDQNAFEVICAQRSRVCAAKKDALELNLTQYGEVVMKLEGANNQDAFSVTDGKTELPLPARIFEPLDVRLEALLAAGGELIVKREGKETSRVSLIGFNAVTTYLRWVASGQDRAVFPRGWPTPSAPAQANAATATRQPNQAAAANTVSWQEINQQRQAATVAAPASPAPATPVTNSVAATPAPAADPAIQQLQAQLNQLTQMIGQASPNGQGVGSMTYPAQPHAAVQPHGATGQAYPSGYNWPSNGHPAPAFPRQGQAWPTQPVATANPQYPAGHVAGAPQVAHAPQYATPESRLEALFARLGEIEARDHARKNGSPQEPATANGQSGQPDANAKKPEKPQQASAEQTTAPESAENNANAQTAAANTGATGTGQSGAAAQSQSPTPTSLTDIESALRQQESLYRAALEEAARAQAAHNQLTQTHASLMQAVQAASGQQDAARYQALQAELASIEARLHGRAPQNTAAMQGTKKKGAGRPIVHRDQMEPVTPVAHSTHSGYAQHVAKPVNAQPSPVDQRIDRLEQMLDQLIREIGTSQGAGPVDLGAGVYIERELVEEIIAELDGEIGSTVGAAKADGKVTEPSGDAALQQPSAAPTQQSKDDEEFQTLKDYLTVILSGEERER